MNASPIDRFISGGRTCAARLQKLLCGQFWLAVAVSSLLAMAGLGCAVAPESRKVRSSVHAPEDIAASQQQIRLRTRALVEPLSGAIVESADRIMAGTTDRAVQREALIWKIQAVPALREALFRPDPLTAIGDTWALTFQMTDYFESGRGKQALGEAAPTAAKTCQKMQTEVATVAASFTKSGDVSDARKFIRQWAREHPIQYSIASRETAVSRVLEARMQEGFSTQELAGSAMVTLDDLTKRLDVYSVQFFDQARWQAELVTLDLASKYELEKAMPLGEKAVQSAADAVGILKRLEPAVNDTLAVAKSAPDLIGRERLAALEYVTKEREAAMKDITKQREAAMLELRQSVAEERKALTNDVEKISAHEVDHAVFRVAQLTAAALAAIFVGVAALIWIARRIFVGRRT